jgi:hypothetical protein
MTARLPRTSSRRPSLAPRRPWAWCNLGRNPFGELTLEERVDVAVLDVEALAAHVRGPRWALQLIGRAGRGKTTRMLALAARFCGAAYVHLPEAQPCPAIPVGWPLLIDEAQRLPRGVRRRIFAAGLPLVLATHRNLSAPLRHAGYQVHTERIGGAVDASLVREIARRRIELCRLSRERPVPRLSDDDADWLVRRFKTDLRAIEGYLYERVQRQAFPTESAVPLSLALGPAGPRSAAARLDGFSLESRQVLHDGQM